MESNVNPGDEHGKTATKQQLKRARVTAIVLGIAGLLSIIFFVFAQIQSIEAKRNKELVIYLERELVTQKVLAEENRLTAVKNERIAKENELLAMKALEECQKKKK